MKITRLLIARLLCLPMVALALSLAVLPATAQNQLWIRQQGTNSIDTANGMASDSAGGVYVCGGYGSLGPNSGGNQNVWLARYDGVGNQLWIRGLGANGIDLALDAAPDGSGGVYVGGRTSGSLGGPNVSGWQAWLARYDSAGNQVWIRQLGTSTSGWVYAYAIAADGSGGAYLSGANGGNLGGASAGNWDTWLAHYDGAGNLTWVRQFGTSELDRPLAAAANGSGGVYLSGITEGSFGGPNAGDYDAWLAKFDSAGNQLWIRQLGTSHDDRAFAAAPDGAGGVYVGGGTKGSLGGPNASPLGPLWDAWIARYDGAGNQLWIHQRGTNGSQDFASTAAPDGAGGVFLGGYSFCGSANTQDAWLVHYDGSGNESWIQQIRTNTADYASASAPDGSGGVYLGGSTAGSFDGANAGIEDAWIARYDGSGIVANTCTPSINSTGLASLISASGSNSVAANDLVLIAGPGPNHWGLFFYGPNALSPVVFGAGSRCVGGPPGTVVRVFPYVLPSASGMLSTTVNNLDPVHAQIAPGATLHFQCWFSDSGCSPAFNLSDRLTLTFVP